MNIVSLLDNVVFLDIETSGLNPNTSEILEIGAVKFEEGKVKYFNSLIKNNNEIPIEIFSLCKGLKQEDLLKAPTLDKVKSSLIKFLGNKTLICHNAKFERSFLDIHIPNIKNEILDSMELAFMLEPYHKEYNLDYLKKKITNKKQNEKHRALYDSIDTLRVVNALLMRLKEKQQKNMILEPLTFSINMYLNQHGHSNWRWSEFIDNAKYELEQEIDFVSIDKKKSTKQYNKDVFEKIINSSNSYEELLKEKDLWVKKEGFIYEYRKGQYELTQTIRQTINKIDSTPNIACIEAPTGIGKSVGYLLPAIMESYIKSKRIIISTDTKELQTQLIYKDIPNVLNSLNLDNKVSYGYIKGKNNYICVEKLNNYKYNYESKEKNKSSILGLIYLDNLVKEGEFGDIEEINYSVIKHFEKIEEHISNVRCDPNTCKPKKCNFECLYKNRIEELVDEDITVINHSLLAKWPYKEEKPLEHIIVDEAHNLTEKGYDFFSSTIESKRLMYMLFEMYPYKYIKNSKFAYEINYKNLNKIKILDRFYEHIHLDENDKIKISTNINFIVDEIKSILAFGEQEYKLSNKYSFKWELNIQSNNTAGKKYTNNRYTEITYEQYTRKIKNSCEAIIKNLAKVLFILDRYINDDSVDKEDDIFKTGKSKVKDLEDIKSTLEILLEYDEKDKIARIIEVDNNFKWFELKVVRLNLADLFEENILSQLQSGIFVSATLTIEENMNYFNKTLGINRINNIVQKIIPPLYNYKDRVLAINANNISNYQNDNFIQEMSNIIANIAQITEGHTLALFTSKERQEKTYNSLKDYLHENNTEIYMDKKQINNLKDLQKKCVVLGSKGCFEGVDIPGDGLICTTLDKLPNINPRDPLYYTIMYKYNLDYFQVNYPQMCIKVKQAMGRILRSKYDYGVFIIFDAGNKLHVLNKLSKELHGCRIINSQTVNMYKTINDHLKKSRKEVLKLSLADISEITKLRDDINDENKIDFYNKEFKNRFLNIKLYEDVRNEKKIKIKYFEEKYLINKV